MLNKERINELKSEFFYQMPVSVTRNELRALLDMADACERRGELLRRYRKELPPAHQPRILADEIDAELERRHEH